MPLVKSRALPERHARQHRQRHPDQGSICERPDGADDDHDDLTMEQIVGDSVSRPRFSALLLAIFAATALLLAAVGVYGVISQLVGQRTQEFGVRMALGASPIDVGRLVVGFGVRLAAIGVALGIPAALAFSRLLSGLLFGVNATSPITYAVVSIGLAIVATLAAILPARRATRVDPLLALRAE